jgi:hypothetical protein
MARTAQLGRFSTKIACPWGEFWQRGLAGLRLRPHLAAAEHFRPPQQAQGQR